MCDIYYTVFNPLSVNLPTVLMDLSNPPSAPKTSIFLSQFKFYYYHDEGHFI